MWYNYIFAVAILVMCILVCTLSANTDISLSTNAGLECWTGATIDNSYLASDSEVQWSNMMCLIVHYHLERSTLSCRCRVLLLINRRGTSSVQI